MSQHHEGGPSRDGAADCARFDALLRESIDDALPAADQAEFDAHLLVCSDCVGRMKDYVVATQVAAAARERDDDVFPALAEPLVARILTAWRAAGAPRENGRSRGAGAG